MLRMYFLQQWFNLSDPAVEEALYDSPVMRQFVGIDLGQEPAPDETTVCSAFAGRTWTWGKDSGHGQSAPASPRSAHHHRHDRGRNHPIDLMQNFRIH
jgi:hypothetical protein